MNIRANKILVPGSISVYAALTFALAMLLLVVSCPVKRLLLNNFNATTSSSSTKGRGANIYQRADNKNYATADCSVYNDKIDVVKSGLSPQHKLPVPLYLSRINNPTGFDINYFLSAVSVRNNPSVYTQQSALPLFLQHLRLLI